MSRQLLGTCSAYGGSSSSAAAFCCRSVAAMRALTQRISIGTAPSSSPGRPPIDRMIVNCTKRKALDGTPVASSEMTSSKLKASSSVESWLKSACATVE